MKTVRRLFYIYTELSLAVMCAVCSLIELSAAFVLGLTTNPIAFYFAMPFGILFAFIACVLVAWVLHSDAKYSRAIGRV